MDEPVLVQGLGFIACLCCLFVPQATLVCLRTELESSQSSLFEVTTRQEQAACAHQTVTCCIACFCAAAFPSHRPPSPVCALALSPASLPCLNSPRDKSRQPVRTMHLACCLMTAFLCCNFFPLHRRPRSSVCAASWSLANRPCSSSPHGKSRQQAPPALQSN